MRAALDTKVLAYAEGVSGEPRQQATVELISRLPQELTFIPVQVLGELFMCLSAGPPLAEDCSSSNRHLAAELPCD
jgi:predicted nucleic acid-binding protein